MPYRLAVRSLIVTICVIGAARDSLPAVALIHVQLLVDWM